MSLSFSEELLSAYLDGEVTPEEQKYVQRLLEEKPELKERLSELTEVSQSVRALPRESAPADFAQSILENLKTPQPSQPASGPKTDVKRSRLRQWSSSLIAVAALFVVGMVLVYQNNLDENSSVGQSNSTSDTASQEMMLADAEGEMEEVVFLKKDASKSGQAPGSLMLDQSEMSDQVTLSLSAPDQFGVGGMAGIAELGAIHTPKVISLDRKTIQKHLSSLGESPSAGDDFSILTTHDDAPILVDFTVVDVQKSLGKLQVLLKNHSVEQIQLDDKATHKKFGANDKLVAVYLNIEEPELESLLNQVVALNATIIVENEKRFSVENFSLQEEAIKEESNLAASSMSRTMPSQEMEPQRYGLGMKSTVSDKEAKPSEVSESVTYSIEQPQNFRFDFDSVRRLSGNSRDASSLSYAGKQLQKNNSQSINGVVQGHLPPTPELPETLENQNSLSFTQKPGESKPVDQPVPSAPADFNKPSAPSVEKPAKNEQKMRRVKAVLILREGNESANSQ